MCAFLAESSLVSAATCTYIKITKGRHQKGTEAYKHLLDVQANHDEAHTRERRKYYKHRHKANTQPDTYMLMYLDGMDQRKTMLPRFTRDPSGMERLTRLKTHVVGSLLFGRTKKLLMCTSTDLWPHDSNLTIEVILRSLCYAAKPLPAVLYLQMDNCWRENKNRHIMSFLSYLLHKKVFRKVRT